MMGWNNSTGGWGWGAWVVMGLVMLLVWSGIAVAVVALLRSASRRRTPPGPAAAGADARGVLDRRFAGGEITEAEYTHQRELLAKP